MAMVWHLRQIGLLVIGFYTHILRHVALLSHPIDDGLSHVTGFGHWHVSECDQSIGFKIFVLSGLVFWAAVIAMMVQGEHIATLSSIHGPWEKQGLIVVNRGVFMGFSGQHYCGNGWLTMPQGHLQAGLQSPTSPAPFPTNQLQPNQSIQHLMKLSIPSHCHWANLMCCFPSPVFLFPECQNVPAFTLLVHTSHSYCSNTIEIPPPFGSFPSLPIPSTPVRPPSAELPPPC